MNKSRFVLERSTVIAGVWQDWKKTPLNGGFPTKGSALARALDLMDIEIDRDGSDKGVSRFRIIDTYDYIVTPRPRSKEQS